MLNEKEKGPERTVTLTFLFLLIFKDDAKSMPLQLQEWRSPTASVFHRQQLYSGPRFCFRGHPQLGQPLASSVQLPRPQTETGQARLGEASETTKAQRTYYLFQTKPNHLRLNRHKQALETGFWCWVCDICLLNIIESSPLPQNCPSAFLDFSQYLRPIVGEGS